MIRPSIFFSFAIAASVLVAQPGVYVTGDASNDVSVIQATTNTIATIVGVGAQPGSMAANNDATLLFVANQNSNTVSVIRTDTNTQVDVIPVASNPLGIAVTPDARRLFVTFPADNLVGVYDVRTKIQLALIPVPDGPYRIAIHPTGLRVYVTSSNGDKLVVIDTIFNRVIRNIPVGNTGTGIAISRDGFRVFVSTQFPGPLADQGPGAIWAIDTLRNAVIGSVRGQFGDPLALSRDGKLLYAINESGLATLQVASLTLVSTTPLDGFINSIGVAPTGSNLYLVYPLENATKVFDTAMGAIVSTIPTGSFPLEVAIPVPR